MAEKKKVRIGLGTFDLIKGIAMLSVIFVHTQWRYDAQQFPLFNSLGLIFAILLGSGAMPMFFLVSGFGFKEKPEKMVLKKTFSELLIPYIRAIPIFFFSYCALRYILFPTGWDLIKAAARGSCGYLLGIPRPGYIFENDSISAGALWFFLALFIATNLLNIVLKIKNTAIQTITVILLVVAGYMLLKLDFLFYCIPQGLMALGFCYFGFMMKKRKLLERWMYSKWTYLILVPIWLLMLAATLTGKSTGFDMATGGFSPLEYLGAGCSGLFSMIISIYLSKFDLKWLEWIGTIGRYSYWILYTHAIEMLAFPWYDLAVLNPNGHMSLMNELTIKVIVILTGYMIFKKCSQIKYQRLLLIKQNNSR